MSHTRHRKLDVYRSNWDNIFNKDKSSTFTPPPLPRPTKDVQAFTDESTSLHKAFDIFVK